MPVLPDDAPWSPLFANVETVVVAPRPSGLSELGSAPGVQLCWAAPRTTLVPLAVPPPWKGAVKVTVPAGCRDAEFQHGDEFSALTLDASDMSFDADIRLSGARVWHGAWLLEAEPNPNNLLGALEAYGLEVVFTAEEIRLPELRLLVGDALPWTRGESQSGDFAAFMDDLGLDVPSLAKHTRRGPYAGAALEALRPLWPSDGPTPPRRARQREALATLDRAQLTPAQQRALSYQLDALAGAPTGKPPAGFATLVVDTHTLEIEVDGTVVLAREMDAQVAEIVAKRASPLEIRVAVPADEAVFVRTMGVGFAASDGGYWSPQAYTGWSALTPGSRHPLVLGRLGRVAPPGTTCIAAEGLPDGVTAELPRFEHAGEQRVVVKAEWPKSALIRPTEAGRYVVVFQEEGMERVRFEADACVGPGASSP